MVFRRHKVLFAVIITFILAAAITAAILISNGKGEGTYKGTLVFTNHQEVAT